VASTGRSSLTTVNDAKPRRCLTSESPRDERVQLRVGGRLGQLRREVQRSFPKVIERLDRGDAEKLVITSGNQMRAVLLTPERYSQLIASANAAG
jgi:hypothetical protein